MSHELRRLLIQGLEDYITRANKRAEGYLKEDLDRGKNLEDDLAYQVNRNYVFLSERWLEAERRLLELEMEPKAVQVKKGRPRSKNKRIKQLS